MNKIKHLQNCFVNGDLNISKLTNEILNVPGQTGIKTRHFLNNVLNFDNANHLEIGVNSGATLSSSLYENNINSSYAIEIRDECIDTILSRKTQFNISFELFHDDCFKFDLSKIKHKINVYFFDGGHTYDDHYKALEYYYSVLDDEFIFIVDDWIWEGEPYYNDWKHVEQSTYDSIKKLGLTILYEDKRGRKWPEQINWWQGQWAAVLKK